MNRKLMEACGFKHEVKMVIKGQCPFCRCKLEDEEWRDELSRKEAQISGLCQSCQDKMFGNEK